MAQVRSFRFSNGSLLPSQPNFVPVRPVMSKFLQGSVDELLCSILVFIYRLGPHCVWELLSFDGLMTVQECCFVYINEL